MKKAAPENKLSMIVFSGDMDKVLAAFVIATGAVAGLAVFYLFALPPLFERLIILVEPARIAVSLALIAPLAFFMGMPFPLGLSRLSDASPRLVPWAWGVNGCASVLSAILATILAMHFGFTVVVASALVLYVAAAAVFRGPFLGRV